MKKVLTCLLLSLPAACLACGAPPVDPEHHEPVVTDCRQQLRRLESMSASWELCKLHARRERMPPLAATVDAQGRVIPPEPRYVEDVMEVFDRDYCELIDPAAQVDACLVNAISSTRLRKEPFCPSIVGWVREGNLAFLVLSDRHAGLLDAMLGSNAEINHFYRSFDTGTKLRRLQRRVRAYLLRHPSTSAPRPH